MAERFVGELRKSFFWLPYGKPQEVKFEGNRAKVYLPWKELTSFLTRVNPHLAVEVDGKEVGVERRKYASEYSSRYEVTSVTTSNFNIDGKATFWAGKIIGGAKLTIKKTA